ncbi:pyridoxal phosphate-dependent aminotransferase [Kordiimonas pumila]|uniref:Pyridoxal phosphate-dependent aminotransferase n=1 Tax=Kordiimonas pumila TaxID=2161677 RepID=A0ABV7D4G0_9PROT|nr:pyridoxal phosphate-dependent aminotransferase [Kordiimonas pumila]
MGLKSPMPAAGASRECYSQWLRAMMKRSEEKGGDVKYLFSSSVEEPAELLYKIIAEAFSGEVTDRYVSTFVQHGNPYFLEQIAERYGVKTDNVLSTTGAISALSLLCRTFLLAGDHVLVENPGFDLFCDIATDQKAVVDFFDREGGPFTIDPGKLESKIRSDTKFVILSNLHNPSGMMLDKAVLEQLAGIAEKHKLMFIFDEVYAGYAGADKWPGPACWFSPYFISVGSLTKIYGLSGLKCGWIVANEEIVGAVRAYSLQFEFGVSKLTHAVGALLLEQQDTFDDFWQSALARSRPVLERHYAALLEEGLVSGELPEFGCILFPKLTGISGTLAFGEWLFEKHHIVVVPGELFGLAGHVRIGWALPPEELDSVFIRLRMALREYRREELGAR